MRNVLISLLLATTIATPALAQSGDRDDRRSERRAERSEQRQQRAEARAERRERAEARSESRRERAADSPARAERVERAERRAAARERVREAASDGGAPSQIRERRNRNLNARGRPTLERSRPSDDTVVNWRRQQRDETVQREIGNWRSRDGRRIRPPEGARPDRPAPAPVTAHRRDRRDHPEWRHDWRRDDRYDWRRWRERNRTRFHLGFYFDPFGWNYRRYNVGWRMWPSYYSQRYWINDPYSYRLPRAPWPYQWVRYYDDALLVDTMTGQVVDVLHNFFW